MEFALLLDEVRALRWPARHVVGGALPGAHRSRLRGTSGEFSEYRPYRQGDDPRRIDWRLLARSDRAYVRLADDHALLPTIVVVDASASMAFPASDGATPAKWERASELAVALAAVAHAAGDPVGLLVDGGATVALPPRARRGVVLELAAALSRVTPDGRASLAPLVRRAGESGGGAGARIVVVSDFLQVDDARTPDDIAATPLARAAAACAARGSDVYAVHVVAAEELAPPRGALLAVDPEDPTVRRPLDAASRAAYEQSFAAWRHALATAWRDLGAAYALVRTDEPAARAVRRVVRGGGGDGAVDAAVEAGT